MPLTEGSAPADRCSASGSAAGSTFDVQLDTALTDDRHHPGDDPAAARIEADETDRAAVPSCVVANNVPEAEEDDGPAAVQIKKAPELLQESGLQASVHDILNDGEEDQMFITGYERCLRKTFLCYVGFLLTFGILRLVMHWRRHWLLLATHRECSLERADKVLIHEAYQRKHDLYYVKDVITLSGDVIR
uniref:Cation-transporting ATPase n=1 Tax=Anopheles stephensi TaxID=30069 RepID=A0A182YS84_ANOST